MIYRVPMFLGVVLFVGLLLQGCGTPMRDGLPVSITPSVIRVKINDVTTMLVTLSRPREKAARMIIMIDDPSIIRPAVESSEVAVAEGQNTVSFTLQGVKEGRTTLRARIVDEGEAISAQVLVAAQ
jgi:hypothetical protein